MIDMQNDLTRPATKKDFYLQYEKIKSNFTSKDDLKKELSRFSTKENFDDFKDEMKRSQTVPAQRGQAAFFYFLTGIIPVNFAF